MTISPHVVILTKEEFELRISRAECEGRIEGLFEAKKMCADNDVTKDMISSRLGEENEALQQIKRQN